MDSQTGPNPETRTPSPEAQPPAGASAIQPVLPGPFDQVTELVVNSVHSEHSRRAYRRALEDFIAWYQDLPGRPPLSKALVHEYRVALTEANSRLRPSMCNSPPFGNSRPRLQIIVCSTRTLPQASPR